MAGKLITDFENSVNEIEEREPLVGKIGTDVVLLFKELNDQRTDIVHAYPITTGTGEQILHRRKAQPVKYFEVTNDFLNSFISRLHKVYLELSKIRAIVRPDLGD